MVQKNNETRILGNSLNILDKGWIIVFDYLSKRPIYICHNTQVKTIDKKLSLYQIQSGYNLEKKIFINNNYLSNLVDSFNRIEPADIEVSKNTLLFKKYNIKLTQDCMIKKGEYFIGYPDRPRLNTPINYIYSKKGSKFSSTWFPIIDWNKEIISYLHLGTYSLGCLTIDFNEGKAGKIWSDLYLYLIYSKLNTFCLGKIYVS